MIIGNHDFHYLKGCGETYSGYQQYVAMDINEVLQPALTSGHLQICHVFDEYIFSHAGLTQTWCENNDIDLFNIEESINVKFMKNMEAFRFEYGENLDRSGNDVTQSPIWARIPSLFNDGVDGFTFVVGHSTLKELTITDRLIGIDTLGTTGEYLVIDELKSPQCVDDCGCFGDALHLTPWQSFTKDIVLLFFILILFFNHNLVKPLFLKKIQSLIIFIQSL